MADGSLPSVYRQSVRARLLDERLTALGRAGRIGFHPDSRGFEPAITAAVLAMRDGDHVFPSARDHAAFLVRGMPIARYVAHAFGSAEDPMHGHAAPAHLSSRELRIGSPSGLLSNHMTHAMGFAWAARLRRDDVAVLTLFGESAANAGDFHSAVNFAGTTKAPLVLLCRTDRTPSVRADARAPTPIESVADKAIGYGIESATCSADDPESVAAAVATALGRATSGAGPTLIEAIRTGAEDPLEVLRKRLIDGGAWDASRDMEMRREMMSEIEAAVIGADRAGPAPRESIFADVYGEMPRHLTDQRNELR